MIANVIFLVVAAVLILVLPRHLAVAPLVLAAVCTTRDPIVSIGVANLSTLRVLVIFGILRVIVRREWLSNGANAMDLWFGIWAFVLIGTSVFHTKDAFTFRSGLIVGELGTYFLFRVFVQNAEDVRRLFRTTTVALAPVALLMLLEKATARNYLDMMRDVITREGHVRATGAFGHAVLAGTVGAMCVPMAMALWRTHRSSALIGLLAGGGMLLASTSSTPILMLMYILLGMALWQAQSWLRVIRWSVAGAVVALQVVMHDPVYFLMARIDITGGSTGWYRSELVRSSIEHLSEWWLVGTDYTRHWMPTGTHADNISADIVNHFLQMGVWGGLPLMFALIMVIRSAFRRVSQGLSESQSPRDRFLVWTLGSMLFGEVMGFWAFSPFDQSVTFFYLIFASLGAIPVVAAGTARQPTSVGVKTVRTFGLPSSGVLAGASTATPSLRRRTSSPGNLR